MYVSNFQPQMREETEEEWEKAAMKTTTIIAPNTKEEIDRQRKRKEGEDEIIVYVDGAKGGKGGGIGV